VGHPAQPPAQAGSPRAGCTAPRPGGTGISPEKETPQPLWAAWARAPSPSEGRSSSSSSGGASSASVCARWPLSCHWAPLERAWPCPPDTHPADICKYILGPLAAFYSFFFFCTKNFKLGCFGSLGAVAKMSRCGVAFGWLLQQAET